MIIDFNSNNLLIKSENVHELDYVVVPPLKQVKVRMAPKTCAIILGAIGQVCLLDNFSHMGLISDKTTVTIPMDSTVYCMVYNKSRRPIFIKRNKCIGAFRVYAKEHVSANINLQIRVHGGSRDTRLLSHTMGNSGTGGCHLEFPLRRHSLSK